MWEGVPYETPLVFPLFVVRGEHLVQAVEDAKQTSDWRSPDDGWRFTPSAINFLNEEQALNYLPRSCDSEANLKKNATLKVVKADLDF